MEIEIENIFEKGRREVEPRKVPQEEKPVKKAARPPANDFPYAKVFPTEICDLIRELNAVYGFPVGFFQGGSSWRSP